MNKNRFRIVFNAARGLRVAVAECARSFGKASTTVCAAVSLFASPLFAQIVADPSAPGGQRPTVLGAPNGVPLVNIQTPSAAGVSRNTYSQFDVNAQGAILNNSRTNVQTQLGGWVQGNPWQATGGARVILNEVNSANASQLRGFVEVAGQRAEVIIANPAGISVNGGGFINASRATLTTGMPVMNSGALDGYRVQGGSVTVGGAGLDARHTDHTAILARAIEVNAGIWANDLQLITGANDIGADQTTVQARPAGAGTTAPAFALDVAQLGGMYAGKITLVGTEAGVGVNNAGTIGASAGDVVLNANGWLSNSGSIHASGHVDVRISGNLTHDAAGVIAAGLNADGTVAGPSSHVTLNAQGDAALQGTLLATGNMRLEGAQLDLRETVLSATGQLSMQAGAQLRTDDAHLQAATIEAQAASLSNQRGEWAQTQPEPAGGAAVISIVVAGALDNTQGRIVAAGDLVIASQALTNDGASLQAQGDVRINTHTGQLSNRAGRITAQGTLTLDTGELINATAQGVAAAIGAVGNLSVNATALHNLAGAAADGSSVHALMWSDAALSIEAGSVNNQASLVAERAISLSADTFSRHSGGRR
jgi:filamentous hemagglutinin